GRSGGPRRRRPAPRLRRTSRRRRAPCPPRAAPRCRRRRSPRRCRPARSRCCSRRARPWSAPARGRGRPARSPRAVRRRRRRRSRSRIRRPRASGCYPIKRIFMTAASMLAIDVPTPSRTYTVTIGDGAIDGIVRLLDQAKAPARRFVVSSPLVWKLHGPQLARALRGADPILVPDGERFKQLGTVTRIYDALVRANADRASTIITFGGGVIGDMAGFAAAIFLRGIAAVHVPTTLLAQVDSAIGGKVGVNHPQGKNLIGAFHQPHAVIVDPLVLGTLPRREFRAGLYEIIKYGMTSSPSLFDRLSRERTAIFARAPEALTPIIAESCRIKADVVAKDERESGLRRILNFG